MTAVLSAMPTRRHSMTSRICCPGDSASTRQRGCTTPNRRRFEKNQTDASRTSLGAMGRLLYAVRPSSLDAFREHRI